MGIWIAIAICIFVLGSVMALKPSGLDIRLDKLRMTARKIDLHPKLVACPKWLRGKNSEFGKGMMGQYGIILDNLKMLHVRYKVVDNQWRAESIEGTDKVDFSLDSINIELPTSILPHVKGLEAKANAIQIYWDDHYYVRPTTNPNYDENTTETELQLLKNQLSIWANTITNHAKK